MSSAGILSRYRYDPLDRLAVCAVTGLAELQRFYLKTRLSAEIQGQIHRTLMQQDDLLLAQHQQDASGSSAMLLATDQLRSVLHSVESQAQRSSVYTPYGHQAAESALTCLLGFNGEVRDPVTGHYPLGNGYRAFNPVLMRFNSPDSLSPFAEGGLNAYAYCLGDPVNLSDPTGHFGHGNLFFGALQRLQAKWSRIRPAAVTPGNVPQMASGAGAFKNVVLSVTASESVKIKAAQTSGNFQVANVTKVLGRKTKPKPMGSTDKSLASSSGATPLRGGAVADSKKGEWTLSKKGAGFHLDVNNPEGRNAQTKFDDFQNYVRDTGIYPQRDPRFFIKKFSGGQGNFAGGAMYELYLSPSKRATFTIRDQVIFIRAVGVHYRKEGKNTGK